MKSIFGLSLFLMCSSIFGQKLHVDYKVVNKSKNSVTIDIYVNKLTKEPMKLAAFNNVFNIDFASLNVSTVDFELFDGFKINKETRGVVLANTSKIGLVQVPNNNGEGFSILVYDKPTRMGRIIIKTNEPIKYPIKLKPSTQGNPTVQAIVYINSSSDSEALTLVSGTISTSFSELIITAPSNYVDPLKFDAGTFSVDLSISPNPTVDMVNVDLSKLKTIDGDVTLSIMSTDGRLLLKKVSVAGQSTSLDLRAYTSGTYQIRVQQGNTEQTFPIIKLQ